MAKLAESFKNFYPLATDFYIEIFDKKEIVLTGNVEVTELDDSVLKIKYGEHGLILMGNNIKIICYNSDGIRLNGNFEKIEFLWGDG